MKQNFSLIKKLISFLMLIVGVSSCKHQTKFSYLKFPASQFKKYVETSPKFKKFIFQFNIPDINKENVGAVYYAIDDSDDIIGGGFLEYVKDSTSKVFNDTAILGNIELTKEYIDTILFANHPQHTFDYLLLVPTKLKYNNITYYPYVYPVPEERQGPSAQAPPPLDPTPPQRPRILDNDN